MCEKCGSLTTHKPSSAGSSSASTPPPTSTQSKNDLGLFLRAAVLTVSDRCSRGEQEDLSGATLERLLVERTSQAGQSDWSGCDVVRHCVPDERTLIQAALLEFCGSSVDIVITTGGTGFAPRDVTPEATRAVIERECPNLSLRMAMISFEKTPFAALSRSVCGIRGSTLIINMPGSSKAVVECLDAVWPILKHAVGLIRDDKAASTPSAHGQVVVGSQSHSHNQSAAPKAPAATASSVAAPASSAPAPQGGVTRKSPWPLFTVNDARQLVLDFAPRLAGELQMVDVKIDDGSHALGLILAGDVAARDNLPPFRASIKDGFAVIASDGAGTFPCTTVSVAGDAPNAVLMSGFVTRIMTGAPLPEGADAVVQVEDTSVITGDDSESVTILKAAKRGQDIREIGSDITEGDVVLSKGTLVGPAELGLMATVGARHVPCVRPLRVGVLSTGDEVQDPFGNDEGTLAPGKIRDSNRMTLITSLRTAIPGVLIADLGISLDKPEALNAKLQHALQIEHCDVIISSGGVSMGDTDFMHGSLKENGFEIKFGRVLMKPGKPCTFAVRDNAGARPQVAFALPGNPVSAFVCLHLFVLPLLRMVGGRSESEVVPTIRVRLAHDFVLDPERPEYHRAIAVPTSVGVFEAFSTGGQRSSRLLSARQANVLLKLPRATGQITKGSMVEAIVVGSLV